MLCRHLACLIGHLAAYLVPCPPVHPAVPPDESAEAALRGAVTARDQARFALASLSPLARFRTAADFL
jgi:hypothetical protein